MYKTQQNLRKTNRKIIITAFILFGVILVLLNIIL